MDTAYRRASAARHKPQHRAAEPEKGTKRRLVQLLVSLGLFLLVFIGRGVFPGQIAAWNQLLSADTDFSAAFQRFEGDLTGEGTFGTAVGNFFLSLFGKTTQPHQPAEPSAQPIAPVTLLGQTAQHGMAYLRSSVLGKIAPEPTAEPSPPQPVETPQPELKTAVAQAFNAAGEALPSNVSYEYYELGLAQTTVPVKGTVTSEFEYRNSPITGKREFHLALDIAAEEGTEIGAFADGVVRYIGENDEFGLYLMIDHDNQVSTFYAHCSKLLVHKGDVITCGQTVALVGQTGKATGAHLHLTILKDNIRLDPAYYVNPS